MSPAGAAGRMGGGAGRRGGVETGAGHAGPLFAFASGSLLSSAKFPLISWHYCNSTEKPPNSYNEHDNLFLFVSFSIYIYFLLW